MVKNKTQAPRRLRKSSERACVPAPGPSKLLLGKQPRTPCTSAGVPSGDTPLPSSPALVLLPRDPELCLGQKATLADVLPWSICEAATSGAGALRGQRTQPRPGLPLKSMGQQCRQTGLPVPSPQPSCPTPTLARPPAALPRCSVSQQPTQAPAIPQLRGPQRPGELSPGTGSGLIADLLSHEGAVFEAVEVHTALRGHPGLTGPMCLGEESQEGLQIRLNHNPCQCMAGS